jgi:hypothetical protein
MLPWAGGLSGFVLIAGSLFCEPVGALVGSGPAERRRPTSVIAASRPKFAVGLSSLIQFIVFVGAFMADNLSVHPSGSNDNYHHISANDVEIMRFPDVANRTDI